MKLMKRFALLAAACGLATLCLAAGWTLKAPYAAKSKLTYNMTVNANAGGQEHEAKMDQVVAFDSVDEKAVSGSASWGHLTVDGNELDENTEWKFKMSPAGAITEASDGAEYARMLAPTFFTYPGKEIAAGDKWTETLTVKDVPKITIDYTVVGTEKLDDKDVLKISAKVKEDKADGLTGDDTFWVGQDGKVQKFELSLHNWVVPMAGSDAVDAKIKGTLAKS